jgi:hypothetical protein
MEGFIKLPRRIIADKIFANPTGLKIYIWMLCKASYKERFITLKAGKGETTVELKPGQFVTGRHTATEELSLNGSKFYRWMKKLEKEYDLIELKSNNQYTLVTICGWDNYQNNNSKNEQQMNSKRTTNEQRMNTNKKDNKVKELSFYEDAVEKFNSTCLKLPKVTKLTGERVNMLATILETNSKEEVMNVIKRTSESDYLNGNNKDGWKASFDWVFKPNNFVKILEGNFENNTKAKSPGSEFKM